MQYVYAALLLHSGGKPVDEAAVNKVLESAGARPESAKVKALVASLKEVNIDEAIKKAAVAQIAVAPAAEAKQAAKAEPKQEEGKTEEEAAEGLSSLFG